MLRVYTTWCRIDTRSVSSPLPVSVAKVLLSWRFALLADGSKSDFCLWSFLATQQAGSQLF